MDFIPEKKREIDGRDILREIQRLLDKEQEAKDYRKVLLKCQAEGGTHNLQEEIDGVVSRYDDSGLAQNEEY
mgnify:CR=1 FL=1